MAGHPQAATNAALTDLIIDQESRDDQPAPSAVQVTSDLSPVMLPVVELIRLDREITVSQFTLQVAAQLERMTHAFALQRERDLAALQQANRLTLALAASLLGAVFVVISFLNLISLRAMNRLVLRIAANPPESARLSTHARAWSADESQLGAAFAAGFAAQELQAAIARLGDRLFALEKASASPAAPRAAASASGQAKASAPKSGSAPAAGKSDAKPHIALAFGQGEALCFLPREISGVKFHAFRRFLAKLKRPFQALRAGKGGQAQPVASGPQRVASVD